MALSKNLVILVGNLGKDPDLRYTPAGTPVCTFSVATSKRYKDKDGETQEKTEWHNIIAWNELAEICGQYLAKGKTVYIEGEIQSRKYQDRNGVDRINFEIRASTVIAMNGHSTSKVEHKSSQEPSLPPEDIINSPSNPDDDIPF